MRSRIFLSAVGLYLSLALSAVPALAERTVLSLNGVWDVAEGSLDTLPAQFSHQVPVPGLLDQATPAFELPGAVVAADARHQNKSYPPDPRREAFWYHRAVKIAGPVPAVALLKVHKALYGTKVFLNGQLIGEHWPCHTPGYFDLRPRLQGNGADNQLVIRVCAAMAHLPKSLMNGWDNEKSRYVPGIYDEVELILSGTPHVVNVQAVPDVPGKSVRVVAELANAGSTAIRPRVTCQVREVASGKPAGQAADDGEEIAAGGSSRLELSIPLADAHLWTPEDPFLYELTVDTGADSCRTRFGLRSFSLDAASGRALLNGRPYFLRGSNVCIFRFFEDAARGALPWDEGWVRRLHRRFKEMHWNSLRYCIGFPPEMWYRIADEEGLLIQDEAPIWFLGPAGPLPETITGESLASEFTEWLRERWNHPCVVIWDAQNETPNSPATGEAIRRVRGLDLSHRPWDNGWSGPQDPGDIVECHPYRANKPDFSLEAFATMNPVPNTVPRELAEPRTHALLINEYGWLWINRDGSLPTLTVDVYRRLLGEQATVAQRQHFYARTLAAKTEFWRAHRQCAGVLHFCGLGYSRSDGQTSDHWIDLPGLQFEPEFFTYVRDAFAPTALMLDFWQPQLKVGGQAEVRVIAINDRYQDWQGTLRLRLLRDGQEVTAQSQLIRIPALGTSPQKFQIAAPGSTGPCQLEAALVAPGQDPVRSVRDVQIVGSE